jgi:hypothetical protein
MVGAGPILGCRRGLSRHGGVFLAKVIQTRGMFML